MRYDLYIDSYRRYKSGTNTVARWLLKQGRECGVAVPSAPVGQRYLMPLNQFVDLAKAISDYGAHIVPHTLLSTLKEVIDLRKAASAFYRQHASGNELGRSDEGHIYTIEVLERVRDVLTPWLEPNSEPPGKPLDEKKDTAEPESNIFGVLTVEDITTSDSQDEENVNTPPSTNVPKASASDECVEAGDGPEEVFFVLYCFFRDLQDLREQIRDTWKLYKAGQTPLISAAITTDIAFDLVRQRESDMLDIQFTAATGKVQTLRELASDLYETHTRSGTPLFWRLKDNMHFNHGYLGDLLFGHIAQNGNINISEDGKVEAAIERPVYDIADMLGMPAYIFLDNLDAMGPGTPMNGKAQLQHVAKYTPMTPALNAQIKFSNDRHKLFSVTHQLRLLHAKNWHDGLPCDIWTKSMMELVAYGKAPIKKRLGRLQGRQGRNLLPAWLVWATTVQLDINRLLDDKSDEPFEELLETGHDFIQKTERFLDWSKRARRNGWDLKLDKAFGPMQYFVRRYLDENPIEDAEKLIRESMADFQFSEPHLLFRNNQLWSGVLSLWFKLSLYYMGIRIATYGVAIFLVTHLYNSLRCNGGGETFTWPDMEHVLSVHRAEYLFCGRRPSDAVECYKRYELAIGVTAQYFSSDKNSRRHANTRIHSARGAKAERQIKADAIPTNVLGKRYRALGYDDEQYPTEAPELLLAVLRRTPKQELTRPESQTHHLAPLLDAFRSTMARDAQHLDFDWYPSTNKPYPDIALHVTCYELLYKLLDELREDIAFANDVFRMRHISKDRSSIIHLPGLIMRTGRSAMEAFSDDYEDRRLAVISPRASAVMRPFVQTYGSRGLNAIGRVAKTAVTTNIQSHEYEDSDDTSSPVRVERELEEFTKSLDAARQQDVANGPENTEESRRAEATKRGEMLGHIDVMGEVANPAFTEMEAKGISGMSWFDYLISKLSPQEVAKFLSTDDLDGQYMILKAKLDVEIAKEKKRKSNKNKNKNRKLKQKAAQGGAEGNELGSSSTQRPPPKAKAAEPEYDVAAVLAKHDAMLRKDIEDGVHVGDPYMEEIVRKFKLANRL